MSKDYPLAYNATLLFQIRYSYLYPRRRINNTVLSYVLYDKCAITCLPFDERLRCHITLGLGDSVEMI